MSWAHSERRCHFLFGRDPHHLGLAVLEHPPPAFSPEALLSVVLRALTAEGLAKTVDVDLGHLGYPVETGHRLRVEISSSCFPPYLPVLGAGTNPWTSVRGVPAEHLLRTDRCSLTFHVLLEGVQSR